MGVSGGDALACAIALPGSRMGRVIADESFERGWHFRDAFRWRERFHLWRKELQCLAAHRLAEKLITNGARQDFGNQ